MTSPLTKTYQLSRIPLYVQVATTLRRRIEDGYWKPGAKISTLDELEEEFKVARVTIRHAVDLLEKEGLVDRRQGNGTFVIDKVRDRRWLQLATTWQSLISMIENNVLKFVPVRDPPSHPQLGEQDGKLAPEYVFLRSVQSRNGEPFGLVSVHLAKHIFDRAPDVFRTRSALPVVARLRGLKISAAHQTFVIATADMEAAELLKIPLSAPTAEAHCVVVDNKGVAVYVADIVYRGDSIKLHVDLLSSVSE